MSLSRLCARGLGGCARAWATIKSKPVVLSVTLESSNSVPKSSFSTCSLWRSSPLRLSRVSGPWLGVSTRNVFVQTEQTPNPNSLKFLPGVEVLPSEYGTGLDIRQFRDASKSPLAQKLFMLPGVSGVFLGPDFVSVTKEEDADWSDLKMDIFSGIMDFMAEGDSIVNFGDEPVPTDSLTILDSDSDVVALIKELIESRIRPTIQDDGGDIIFEGFDEGSGMVNLRLAGSCVGCSSSEITLKSGVERMLMHYIPEVLGIQQVVNEEEEQARKAEFHIID